MAYDNSSIAVQSNNAAIQKITGGAARTIQLKEDIRKTAAKNTASVDNSDRVKDEVEKHDKSAEHRLLWSALGIAIAVGILLVLALKYKIIKI